MSEEPPAEEQEPEPIERPKPTIANKEVVKLMLGNPGVCVVSDEELDAAIGYGDSEVVRRVGYTPSLSDPDYPSYSTASAQFAVFLINNKFPALAKNAQSAWAAAVATCDSIVQLSTDIDSPSNLELVTSADYQTAPLNPDALYRYATRSRGGIGGTGIINGDYV